MRQRRICKALLCATAIFCGSIGVLRAGGLQYAITNLGDLGYLPAEAESHGLAINIHDQITGEATSTNGDVHAFLYSTNGGMVDLGTLLTNDLGESYGYGINDQGVVVGTASNTNITDAFYVTTGVPGAKMVDMGTLGGVQGSAALGINNENAITGDGDTSYGETPNPFLDSVGGARQGLGDLNGKSDDTYSGVGRAINGSGVIVGSAMSPVQDGPTVPFINTSSGMVALPLLGGNTSGSANAINSSGAIAGTSGSTAVIWTNGVVASLGYLTTNESNAALGINDAGVIVGEAETTNFAVYHAFVYMNGTMTDLNDVIAPGPPTGFAYLYIATAINNNGHITGYGVKTNGITSAFLATPYVAPGSSGPSIVMNVPVVTNKQVLLNFVVTDLTNATYRLLQTTQLTTTSWTTNLAAVLTTNTLNSSYRFTVTNNSNLRFYRVLSP